MALLDGLSEAFRRLDCSLLSGSAYILGGLRAFTGPGQGGLEAGINGLRRLRGCDPANDIEPPPPPFTGGQCENVTYRVSGTYSGASTAGQTQFFGPINVPGPVTGITSGPPTSGGPDTVNVVILSGDGTQTIALQDTPSEDLTFRITTAVRLDGLPDECGNPPPTYPPPINVNVDVDVTYLDEGDDIVNVTIPVEFKPFTVNFNGDVSFPFDFNLGGIDFDGSVSFAPEFRLTINPPRLPPGPINPPPSGSEPETPAPLAPRGNKVQGVIVIATVDSDAEVSSYEGSPVPDIFVPRLGSVKFAYSFGVSTVWSNDIDVKGTAVFIPCPFSQGADAVQGRPQPGVTFQLSAVTGPPLATVVDIN